MKLQLEMRTENIDFDRYKDVYYSEEFNALAMPAAKLRERSLQKHEVLVDGRELRKVRMVPDIHLPSPVMRLLNGEEIAYTEVTLFDPQSRRARLDVRSAAGDVVKVGGDVHFTEDKGGVTLHFDGEVKVKVFGLGKIIEKIIVNQVRDRYAAIAPVLQTYVDEL